MAKMRETIKAVVGKKKAKKGKLQLPPDPEDMNDERAEWAEAAISEFQSQTGADLEDAVCDLIADLKHWCDRNGQDFEAELARAMGHYNAETEPFDEEEA